MNKFLVVVFSIFSFTTYSQILDNIVKWHYKKSIRFFTRGNDAVELTDQDGLIYLIGSQKAEELERSINNIINS